MSNNPFSLKGRIKRLPYFLCCSTLFVALAAILYSLLSGRISDEMFAASAPNEQYASLAWIAYLDTISQLKVISCIVIYAWLSLVLLFKRTRDMNGSMSFAYVYIIIYLAVFIPAFGAVSSFLTLCMNLMLMFKDSTDFVPKSSKDYDDAAEKSDWVQAENTVIGSETSHSISPSPDGQIDPPSPLDAAVFKAHKSLKGSKTSPLLIPLQEMG